MKLLEKMNRRLLGKGYPGREAVAENFRILNTAAIANASASGSCTILSTVSHGTRYLLSTACAEREKLP